MHSTNKNLFLEGDNLDGLYYLRKDYMSKIKMIYIDPPYNTGTKKQYKDKFTHAEWKAMMYPRLVLARDLLKDDGVIFISIDDNEVHHLRCICDEIFGERNFVGQMIWKRRASSALADNNFSTDHEYVIVYHKGNFRGMTGDQKDYAKYSNPDNDPRGEWIYDNLTVGMTSTMRPNQFYDLKDPKTGVVYPCNLNRVWAYIRQSMDKLIEDNRIYFPSDKNKRPMLKRFKNELKSDHNPCSSIMIGYVGLNTEGTRVVQDIMGGNFTIYPKPITLLERLIKQSTQPDDIILDFFAGSCTTAHAVMKLNAEDGGNRKFIMVQNAEPCDPKSEAFKAGYKTIADIGKERIRRAAKQLEVECDFEVVVV